MKNRARPAIPVEVARRLLVECGHRCAVCGEAVALEKAHIEPWSESHDHSFENLIVLCATCHTRSHAEAWDANTLREYKRAPWVTRSRAHPEDHRPREVVC